MPAPQMCISRASNLAYLPLVYFLPEHLIVRCPTLRRLPRKIREEEGRTYQEIAAKLDYKTHSAVVKKMKVIREAYQELQG